MNKPLEQLNLEELKALAYDQIIELNRVQKNIQVLEARIAEVSKLPSLEQMQTGGAGNLGNSATSNTNK